MANEIITTLHPDGDQNTDLYPNIKKDNIPNKSIDRNKLGDDVNSLLNSINELHPSGVDTSTNILAFTTNKGIWVGSDTGHWYYWSGAQYVDGGVYQASASDTYLDETSNNSVENSKITQEFNAIENYEKISNNNVNLKSGYLNTSGVFTSSVNFKCGFYNAKNVKAIRYKMLGNMGATSILFLDKYGNKLSSSIGSVTQMFTGTIKVPDNCVSIGFTFVNSDVDPYIIFIKKDYEIISYDDYDLSTISDDWEYGYLNVNGIVVNSQNFFTTNYIEINYLNFIPMAVFYGNTIIGSICFYDENKIFIESVKSSLSSTGFTTFENISIPYNTKYVRVTFTINNYGNTQYLSFTKIDNKLVDLANEIKNKYNYNYKHSPYNYKKINIIGDSITQGSRAYSDYDDSYVGILRKMLNIEFGGKLNYGFVSAFTYKPELHMTETMLNLIGTNGGWTRNYASNEAYGSDQLTSNTLDTPYQMTLSKQFNYIKVAYVDGYEGSADFVVYDNNDNATTLLTIITTSGDKTPELSQLIDISSYPQGTKFGVIAKSGVFSFSGFEIGMDTDWVTLNNYGRAGAGVQTTTGSLLDKESDCDLLIYAYGTNNTSSEISTYLNNIKTLLKSKNCDKLVLCNCFYTSSLNRFPNIDIMRKWAYEINADFISSYELLPKDSDGYTLSSLLSDGIHPNDKGHALISEIIAKRINLSTLSKDLEDLEYTKFNLHY